MINLLHRVSTSLFLGACSQNCVGLNCDLLVSLDHLFQSVFPVYTIPADFRLHNPPFSFLDYGRVGGKFPSSLAQASNFREVFMGRQILEDC